MYKRSVNITRIKQNEVIKEKDVVLVEAPIDLYVNSESLVNIICLPKDLKELAVGFLYSIGVIENFKDINNIYVDELDNRINVDLADSIDFSVKKLEINPVSRVVDTTCGISSPWRNAIKASLITAKEDIKAKQNFQVSTNVIFSANKTMQTDTIIYRETGGCHGAGIFDLEGTLLGIKEDIGRHNAIDKIIGDMLIKEQDFSQVFLFSTGRLTGDSVLKAIRAKIPLVASISAGIESGIRLAFAYGITLIGFVRGARMNIYSHPERVI